MIKELGKAFEPPAKKIMRVLAEEYFHARDTDENPLSPLSFHLHRYAAHGHALNNTLQDGYHPFQRDAGITHCDAGWTHAYRDANVVEQQPDEEGLSRHDLGQGKNSFPCLGMERKNTEGIINQLKRELELFLWLAA